ncbi:hypothetical protein [Streptomyces sp. NPDC099088]
MSAPAHDCDLRAVRPGQFRGALSTGSVGNVIEGDESPAERTPVRLALK